MVVAVLLEGELVEVKVMSLGWMTSEKVNHDVNIIRNQGSGLS